MITDVLGIANILSCRDRISPLQRYDSDQIFNSVQSDINRIRPTSLVMTSLSLKRTL